MKYAIAQAGRDAFGNFTLFEARAELRRIVREEKKRCAARYGNAYVRNAYVHKAGDSYRITLARDKIIIELIEL